MPIEEIRAGDIVYDENGQEIHVLRTYQNGPREVHHLTYRTQLLARATGNHVFLTSNSSSRGERRYYEQAVADFSRDTQISRVELELPLGEVHCPEQAYSLASLLGDGCSREHGLAISSGDARIPEKVAEYLDGTAVRQCDGNYTYILRDCEKPLHYVEWCEGRYAHEKIAELDVIRTWNRETLLAYLAGLIDTDGSVLLDKWNNLVISLGMQAKSVVESAQYALLALFQTDVQIGLDARDKYVHGPLYTLKVASNAYSRRILRELDQYLVSPHKKWKAEYSDLVSRRSDSQHVGVRVSEETELVETYDIHVDSPTNLYCLANGLVTHNSGKTQVGAREATWILTETHPTWTRPSAWGDEPLLLLVMGRTTKQVEEVIYRKMRAFIPEGELKEQRVGGVIQKVTHIPTGNVAIFMSHHSAEEAREKAQAFVAHYVWLDEMPGSYKLIEELHRRIQARDGRFLATFTPKVVNAEIRRLVDAADGTLSRKYQMSMLDNPVYAGREEEILVSLATYSEAYRRTVLYGDWSVGEEQVYYFDWDAHVRKPEGYSPILWRHTAVVDPALSSKLGLTIWAEEPSTGHWYCVVADYVSDILVPTEVVAEVERKLRPYNIVRRISDPHEVWYIQQASAMGYSYMGVYDKNRRKGELIKGLQEKLGSRLFLSPEVTDLITELQECRWSERAVGKIVNASSYHLLDTAQYFADNIPTYDPVSQPQPWHSWLRRQNEKRVERVEKRRQASAGRGRIGRSRRTAWGRK